MKRSLSIFLGLLVIICIASCGKNNLVTPQKAATDTTQKIVTKPPTTVVPPPKTLIGRWDMTQENYVKYLNGVKLLDVTGQAFGYNSAYVIFNSDSTYTCLAMDWYPALSTYGVDKDNSAGTFSVADSSLSVSTYLAGLNTIYYGGPPDAPPALVPVSNKIMLRQYTDSTLTVHQEYVFNNTDPSAGTVGSYKYIWDLFYIKQAADQPVPNSRPHSF